MGDDKLSGLVRGVLDVLDPEPGRAELTDTPARVAEAWRYFTRGYDQSVADALRGAVFDEPEAGLVLVRDIEFYSLCEHHLLPFFGSCHIAYLPAGRIVGLSKLARIVEIFARRLQVQERMTRQVAEAIQGELAPEGVAVVTEARHLCMGMRGVEKHRPVVESSTLLGVFERDASLRGDVLSRIGRPPAGSR